MDKNYDKESSDSSEDIDYQKDINNLKNLWQEIKHEKPSKELNFKKKKNNDLNDPLSNNLADLANKNNLEIKELNSQLDFERNQKKLLIDQLKQVQNDYNKLKVFMEKQNTNIKEREGITNHLASNLNQINQSHDEVLMKINEKITVYNRELALKDDEIKRLRTLLEEQNTKLKSATISHEKVWENKYDLEKLMQSKNEEISRLEETINELRLHNDELDLSKRAEGTFMIEVEHLRADVKRLVKMLRATSEFKNFADFADDSGQSIRFLKGISKDPSTIKGIKADYENEKLLWIPEEAFRFAHEYRLKYNGYFTETIIESLLFELNKIWSRREELQTSRIKGSYAKQMNALKRQIQVNPSFDQFTKEKEIQRLKNELKIARKENRDAFSKRETRNPPGIRYVNETMKMNKDLHSAKEKMKNQTNFLQEKLEKIETQNFKDNSEKVVFMEGASWMAKQNLFEIENIVDSLNELKENVDVNENFENTVKILENIKSDMEFCKRKIKTRLETSQREMISAKTKTKY